MNASTVPLEDAFSFQEGPGVRKWQFTNTGIKLLNVGNILAIGELDLEKTDRCLSREEVEKRYKHFLVDEGDLVIASSGISFDNDGLLRTRGAFVHRSHLPLCLNTSTIRFKPKADSNLRFLKYWLDSYEFRAQITRLVTGSAQQNFGPSHLENICITLPNAKEQRRIVEELERVDGLRRTRRYALELAESLLPAAFLQLFGDPVTNDRGWQTMALESASKKITDGEHLNPKFVAEGLPMVMAEQVEDTGVNLHPCKLVSIEDFTKFVKKCEPQAGDILIVSRGATIGRTCVVDTEKPFCLMGSAILIKPKGDVLNPYFLSTQLKTASFLRVLRSTSGSSAQQAIYIANLRGKLVVVPPLPLQQQFAALVERVEQLRAKQQEALRQAEHLFQTLLHQSFSTE